MQPTLARNKRIGRRFDFEAAEHVVPEMDADGIISQHGRCRVASFKWKMIISPMHRIKYIG